MKDITLANRLNWTKNGLSHRSVYEILDIIRTGAYQLVDPEVGEYSLKDATKAIRTHPDANIQNFAKLKLLPVAMFNGIWDGAKITNYSEVTVLDFDYIYSQYESDTQMAKLQTMPCVLSVFRTFKPYRLKAVVLHDNQDPTRHKDMYEQLINMFDISLLDTTGKDLSRKTYLPWDETIWINPSPVPFHFDPTVQAIIVPAINDGQHSYDTTVSGKSPRSIINILNSSWRTKHPEYWQEGNRAVSIFKCACQFAEYGIPMDMAEEYFVAKWNDMAKYEILHHVRGAYKAADYNSRIFY